MYNDNYPLLPPYNTPYPELDDPSFWAGIAAQTGIPAYRPVEPIASLLPSVYEQQQRGIVEGSITLVSETRALAPYQPVLVPPLTQEEPRKADSSAQGTLTQVFLWVLVIVVVGLLVTNLPAQHAGPPNTTYSVIGNPSVSADFMNQVLDHYGSPARGKGQPLYEMGISYGVDPVFALAFFMHESSFGKAGMATATLGLGNERCITDRPCINTQGGQCQAGQSCYAQFYSWEDGFEHWYMLITGPVYKGSDLTTVDTIIPRYAPNADHNNEAEYIASLKKAVDTWRAGKIEVI